MNETKQSTRGYQVRRLVLVATAVVTGLSVVYELFLAGNDYPESVARSLLPAALAAVATWESFHGMRTDLLMLFIVGVYGVVGMLDALLGTNVSGFDSTTTLTALILVGVIYVATRERQTGAAVIGLAVFISIYSVVIVLANEFPPDKTIGILVLGIPGQSLALWMIYRLIRSLNETSALQARHAHVQRALARCSQALLNRGNPAPLESALKALLDATEADYAYIDVNTTEPDGRTSWEIVAEAAGEEYPSKEGTFNRGDYSQLEFVVERMERGLPARIIVSNLPMPTREEYEAEQIKAELTAPIHMGERWVGSLGYTDHRREGDWTEIEEEGLMRAAEMVAAYWEREAAREGLMELAQAKDQFIATVSHELRTPLTAVVGFAAELIGRGDALTQEEAKELASLIHDQSVEVSQLVDDLLTAERAASGNLTVKPSEFALLQACRDLVSSTTIGHEVEIAGEEVVAWADGLRTRQIIRNLLTNAVKYGGESIVVEVGSTESRSSVLVKDNGPGVQGIDEERIFDAYYRAQDGHTKPDSVGLGLAVSRQLAELMGGNIAYSRVDGWTSFELTLPLASRA